MNYLSNLNPHPRDQNVSLDEATHIYNINGDYSYTSVTTWNHKHFSQFDADKIIANMMSSKNWPTSKYNGMTSEQIKEGWDKNRDEAAAAGTKLHYDIECYYNNYPTQTNTSIEYQYFLNFARDFQHLKPYRTEWIVYDEEWKIAGSIDMIFENPDEPNTIDIYDWKRAKEIQKSSAFNKWSTNSLISHLPDTNFWHYSLQLNTYKAIIERNYGKKVRNLYLVVCHPNNKNNNYQIIKVPNLQEEISTLIQP